MKTTHWHTLAFRDKISTSTAKMHVVKKNKTAMFKWLLLLLLLSSNPLFECAYTWLIQTSARRPLPQLWSESLCQREPTAPAHHHHPAVGKQEPVVECEDCINKRTTVCLYMVLSHSCQFYMGTGAHLVDSRRKKNQRRNLETWETSGIGAIP